MICFLCVLFDVIVINYALMQVIVLLLPTLPTAVAAIPFDAIVTAQAVIACDVIVISDVRVGFLSTIVV